MVIRLWLVINTVGINIINKYSTHKRERRWNANACCNVYSHHKWEDKSAKDGKLIVINDRVTVSKCGGMRKVGK